MITKGFLASRMFVGIFAAVMTMTGLSSCSERDDPSPSDPSTDIADYAVLLYGHGSASPSLDFYIIKNIHDCYMADPASYYKVKVAVQYKWTTAKALKTLCKQVHYASGDIDDFDVTPEEIAFAESHGSTAVRFVVDPAQKGDVEPVKDKVYFGPKQMVEAPQYGEKGFNMSNPDSLISFINWAEKACPAKHYILVFSSHGEGYRPNRDVTYRAASDGATTRGVIPDADNDGKQLSVSEVKAALKAADKRIDVVYYDACLMNMIEVLYELRDVTDYIIASTFTVPGVGGDFSAIINELAKGNPMETALANICKANGDFWAEQYAAIGKRENANFDQSVIRTSAIESYAAKIKDFTNRLVDAYTNGGDEVRKKIDLCTANAMKVESNEPFYELHAYMALIVTGLPEYFPDGYFEDIRDSFLQTCIVNRFSSPNLEKYGFQIGVSTLLAHEGIHEAYAWIRDFDGTWRTYGYTVYYPDGKQVDVDDGVSVESTWGGTFADTYQQLDYDRATGWSRWLLLNKQRPAPFCYLSAEIEPTDIIEDVPF